MRGMPFSVGGVIVAVTFCVACSAAVGTGNGPPGGAPSGMMPSMSPVPSPSPSTGLPANFSAGAAAVAIDVQSGVPLAGYSGRRAAQVDLDPSNFVTLFEPSVGTRDAVYAKALVLSDGDQKVALVSVDAIAMIGDVAARAVARAITRGGSIPLDNVMLFASHSHSGPGAISDLHFWEIAAADVLDTRVRDRFVERIADALVFAEQRLVPARLGSGVVAVFDASKNRRADISPTFVDSSIDPELLVLRIDRADGLPIATLWNFAIHGTALGASSRVLSADVMGGVSAFVETSLRAPALFANGAEGDIKPAQGGEAGILSIGASLGQKILDLRATIATTDHLVLENSSEQVDFGDPKLRLSGATLADGGDIDLAAVGAALGNPTGTLALGSDLLDHVFRVQAIRLNEAALVSMPGEAIHTLGRRIKDAGLGLGFSRVFAVGLANGHMSYITDESEYAAGGYEALASFFGASGGTKLVDACAARLSAVKP